MDSEEKQRADLIVQKQAFELLINEALTFTEIADRLEVTRAEVVRLVKGVLDTVKASDSDVREYRIIVNQRLDYWLSKLAKGIKRGDRDAILTAIRIEERRAKLLGLDKPTKIDITHHLPTRDPQEAARRQRERLNRDGFLKLTTSPPSYLLPAPKEGVDVTPQEPDRATGSPGDEVDLGSSS